MIVEYPLRTTPPLYSTGPLISVKYVIASNGSSTPTSPSLTLTGNPYASTPLRKSGCQHARGGACHQLGVLYSDQGKMKEAEDMYLRALAGKEKAWGLEYKQALDTKYNLGLLYKEGFMFANAVQQFELVVKGYRKLLGSEYNEIVETLKYVLGARASQ